MGGVPDPLLLDKKFPGPSWAARYIPIVNFSSLYTFLVQFKILKSRTVLKQHSWTLGSILPGLLPKASCVLCPRASKQGQQQQKKHHTKSNSQSKREGSRGRKYKPFETLPEEGKKYRRFLWPVREVKGQYGREVWGASRSVQGVGTSSARPISSVKLSKSLTVANSCSFIEPRASVQRVGGLLVTGAPSPKSKTIQNIRGPRADGQVMSLALLCNSSFFLFFFLFFFSLRVGRLKNIALKTPKTQQKIFSFRTESKSRNK